MADTAAFLSTDTTTKGKRVIEPGSTLTGTITFAASNNLVGSGTKSLTEIQPFIGQGDCHLANSADSLPLWDRVISVADDTHFDPAKNVQRHHRLACRRQGRLVLRDRRWRCDQRRRYELLALVYDQCLGSQFQWNLSGRFCVRHRERRHGHVCQFGERGRGRFGAYDFRSLAFSETLGSPRTFEKGKTRALLPLVASHGGKKGQSRATVTQ
jgi:hypothetical protein